MDIETARTLDTTAVQNKTNTQEMNRSFVSRQQTLLVIAWVCCTAANNFVDIFFTETKLDSNGLYCRFLLFEEWSVKVDIYYLCGVAVRYNRELYYIYKPNNNW